MNKIRILIKIIRSIYSHEYNKKHPIKAFFRSGKWYSRSLFRTRDFYDNFWDYKIKFWLNSNQSLWLYRNYIMDWNEFNFIKKVVKPNDTIFDVGSNIGVYSLWFSKYVGTSGKIFAFEPDNDNISRFRELVALNNIKTINISPFAVSDKDGKLYFTKNKDNENQITDQDSKEDKIEIESVSLDKFCRQKNIDRIHYLKIDIEGAEYLAFKGAEYLLSNNKIDVIQFEINNHIMKFDIDPIDLVKYLQKFNYDLYEFNVETNHLKKLEVEKVDFNGHSNYFALNNYNEIIKRLNDSNSSLVADKRWA